MFEDFDSIYEYDRDVAMVGFEDAGVVVDIDFTQIKLAGAASRKYRRFGVLAEMAPRPAVYDDYCAVHKA